MNPKVQFKVYDASNGDLLAMMETSSRSAKRIKPSIQRNWSKVYKQGVRFSRNRVIG